jgi:hypothetical protein
MLTVRGDGSARSQQTRLGKALAAKRDRVFNGLTIKRLSQGEKKHGVLYALERGNGGNRSNGPSRRDPDLLDFAEGNVDDVEGNMGDKRSPSLGPIDSITSGDLGNVGNVGNLFPSSREEKNTNTEYAEREIVIEEGAKTAPNVPHVPLKSAIETKEAGYVWGTFERNVPLTFPRGSPTGGAATIDLAAFPDAGDDRPP